jgi:hypothetical protein
MKSKEEFKFKNRQIGAAGFVANQIMENMINKPKLDTVGKEFYESADKVITVKRQKTLNLDKLESKLDDALAKETKESLTDWLNSKRNKQETLEEAAENYLLSSVERNQYGDELSFIDGTKWQAERMYEIMNAYADDVMGGCNLRAKEWFEKFKSK